LSRGRSGRGYAVRGGPPEEGRHVLDVLPAVHGGNCGHSRPIMTLFPQVPANAPFPRARPPAPGVPGRPEQRPAPDAAHDVRPSETEFSALKAPPFCSLPPGRKPGPLPTARHGPGGRAPLTGKQDAAERKESRSGPWRSPSRFRSGADTPWAEPVGRRFPAGQAGSPGRRPRLYRSRHRPRPRERPAVCHLRDGMVEYQSLLSLRIGPVLSISRTLRSRRRSDALPFSVSQPVLLFHHLPFRRNRTKRPGRHLPWKPGINSSFLVRP
jgi:hypothetical protein